MIAGILIGWLGTLALLALCAWRLLTPQRFASFLLSVGRSSPAGAVVICVVAEQLELEREEMLVEAHS